MARAPGELTETRSGRQDDIIEGDGGLSGNGSAAARSRTTIQDEFSSAPRTG